MTTNILRFDPNGVNLMSDPDYLSDSQRTDGVVPGIAVSALHNKLFYQTSAMAAALGQALSDYGYTISDADYAGIVTAISNQIQQGKIRAVTSGPDTILAADRNNVVTYTSGSSIAVTLPQATATGDFGYAFSVTLINEGSGVVTVTPTTSTIDGAASLTLSANQSITIFSNNTNYFTARGRANPITRNVTASAAASCPFALGTGPATLVYGWSKVNTDNRNQFLQFSSDGGSNYLAANYRYSSTGRNDGGTGTGGSSTSAAGILLNSDTTMGSDTGEYMGLLGIIFPLGTTSTLKAGAVGVCITQTTAGVVIVNVWGGIYTGTAANMNYARLVDTAGGNVTSNLTIQDL